MGFNTVVGFMFSFFIFMGIILFSFVTFIEDTKVKADLIGQNEEILIESTQDFSLSAPYTGSGRTYFDIVNNANNDLFFRGGNRICFDIFLNDQYVDKTDTFISLDGASAQTTYDFIEPQQKATISINGDLDTSINNEFKIVSCEGVARFTYLNVSDTNWYNNTYSSRVNIVVVNNANNTINEYQVEIDLNSSNFNFNVADEDEIRVLMPANEGYVLDLTLDGYTQTLDDDSKVNNEVFLGASAASEGSDPLELENGVISQALSFEGDDYLTITLNESLVVNNSISYSFWINWDVAGTTTQTIIQNSNNSVKIINDGGANDDQIEFNLNISGTLQTLYSTQTLDSNWHHVVAKYDGTNMSIYIDGVRDSTSNILGSVYSNSITNYIGASSGATEFLSGDLDEIKFVNYDLTDVEISQLYSNSHRFKSLPFYISYLDGSDELGKLFVKTPAIQPFKNITFQIYYESTQSTNSASDIEETFSYTTPRLIGFVNHDRLDANIGLSLVSLYDDNIVIVGDNTITDFDEQEGSTISAANTDYASPVYVKYLANIEGNGGGGDIISPLAWAGTEFAYGRPQSNPDVHCMLSPFGNSTYQIHEIGVEVARGWVNQSGLCRNDINHGGGVNIYINFSLPSLLHYSGGAASSVDVTPLYPLASGNFFVTPSNRIDISSGASATLTAWFEGDGVNDGVFNLNAFVDGARSGLGADGNEHSMKLIAYDPVGIIKDHDGDGSEYTVVLPEKEFGVKYGSNEDVDYVVMSSSHPDANCSIYAFNNPVPLQTIERGTGTKGVYNYSLGNPGTDTEYTATRWKVECDKPAIGYNERANNGGDEANLMGHLQIRQFIYPEPTIIIS